MLATLVLNLKMDKKKVLICAPSNAAVDQLAYRVYTLLRTMNECQVYTIVRVGRGKGESM